MDKADVETAVKQAIYNVIEHPDLAIGTGITTEHGTFYRLSAVLVEAICDTAWFESHTHVDDSIDLQQLKDSISTTLLNAVGYPDVTGYESRSLINTIIERLIQ